MHLRTRLAEHMDPAFTHASCVLLIAIICSHDEDLISSFNIC